MRVHLNWLGRRLKAAQRLQFFWREVIVGHCVLLGRLVGQQSRKPLGCQHTALGLYRVTTETPWEQGSLTFEGVLFSEVAKYLGFEDASALRVRALDDYIQDVPREDWVDKPLILATRQDGVPLARRTQGPARLIYPLSEYAGYDSTVHDARWIWLIKSIEPVR